MSSSPDATTDPNQDDLGLTSDLEPQELPRESAPPVERMRRAAKKRRAKKKATRRQTQNQDPSPSPSPSPSRRKATAAAATPTPPPAPEVPPALIAPVWEAIGSALEARGASPLTSREVSSLAAASAPVLALYLSRDSGPWAALGMTIVAVFAPRIVEVKQQAQLARASADAELEHEQRRARGPAPIPITPGAAA